MVVRNSASSSHGSTGHHTDYAPKPTSDPPRQHKTPRGVDLRSPRRSVAAGLSVNTTRASPRQSMMSPGRRTSVPVSASPRSHTHANGLSGRPTPKGAASRLASTHLLSPKTGMSVSNAGVAVRNGVLAPEPGPGFPRSASPSRSSRATRSSSQITPSININSRQPSVIDAPQLVTSPVHCRSPTHWGSPGAAPQNRSWPEASTSTSDLKAAHRPSREVPPAPHWVDAVVGFNSAMPATASASSPTPTTSQGIVATKLEDLARVRDVEGVQSAVLQAVAAHISSVPSSPNLHPAQAPPVPAFSLGKSNTTAPSGLQRYLSPESLRPQPWVRAAEPPVVMLQHLASFDPDCLPEPLAAPEPEISPDMAYPARQSIGWPATPNGASGVTLMPWQTAAMPSRSSSSPSTPPAVSPGRFESAGRPGHFTSPRRPAAVVPPTNPFPVAISSPFRVQRPFTTPPIRHQVTSPIRSTGQTTPGALRPASSPGRAVSSTVHTVTHADMVSSGAQLPLPAGYHTSPDRMSNNRAPEEASPTAVLERDTSSFMRLHSNLESVASWCGLPSAASFVTMIEGVSTLRPEIAADTGGKSQAQVVLEWLLSANSKFSGEPRDALYTRLYNCEEPLQTDCRIPEGLTSPMEQSMPDLAPDVPPLPPFKTEAGEGKPWQLWLQALEERTKSNTMSPRSAQGAAESPPHSPKLPTSNLQLATSSH